MSTPQISVVMSIYNGEKYLTETMISLINQTLKNFELIIINDGSADNTLKILKQFQKEDKRIIIINNKKNLGFIKSLNKGLAIAKGKYIARMDADDICLSDRLYVQYQFLEKNKDIFLAGSYAINIDENGNKISLFKPPINHKEISKILPKRNCMYHNTIIFRNTKEIKYREKMIYTEDYDLYLNCLSKGKKLANIPEYLVKYRRLPYSASFSKKGKQILFSKKAKEFYEQRINTGKDDYMTFNPETILTIDINKINEPDVLKEEINAYFAVNNTKKIRYLSKIYLKKYGLINEVLLYYLSTYINTNLLNIIKRFALIIKRKY